MLLKRNSKDLHLFSDREFLQLELEVRPVLLVEVRVDLFRDVIELLRPPFEDRVGRLVTLAAGCNPLLYQRRRWIRLEFPRPRGHFPAWEIGVRDAEITSTVRA